MGRLVLKIKYVVRQLSKGREYFYFRRGNVYERLPAPTDPTFDEKYKRLLKRFDRDLPSAPAARGSFADLVERYLASQDFLKLAKSTQREYRRLLDRMKTMWGDLPAKRLGRNAVMEYRDSLSATPRQAGYAMQVLRRLCSFGVDREILDSNPALRPGTSATPEHGHEPWTDDAIKQFREVNADRPMMLFALILGLCTGQRRSDLVKMTLADYNGTEIAVVQDKTNEKVWVPAHATLRGELDGLKRFMLLQTERGHAFKPRHFSNLFLDSTRRANLNGYTLHGLRVTAATWLAEAGCTDAELQTILGHRTVTMAAMYRRRAQKRTVAASAIRRLEQSRPKV